MRPTRTAVLLGITVMMISFNLRTIAVAIGPVLPELQSDLAMSGTVAGVLTALPTLCFSFFGFLAPRLAVALGLHRTILLSLVVNVIGQVARIMSVESIGFMAATIAALAGLGVINILLPPLVKRHFPARNGLMTALYSVTQSLGLTVASVGTAPLAIALGGWQGAFWVWAATSAIALPLVMWATARFRERLSRRRVPSITLRQVARTKLGWMMMLFFGMQSAQAYGQFGWLPSIYQDAGFTPVQAGNYLGILAGVGIPLSFVVPNMTARMRRPEWLLVVMVVCGMLGYAGLVWDPSVLPWLWPTLTAVAGSSFTMILTLLSRLTRTPAGTAALSSFAQSAGYIIAALGPFLLGALRDATGEYMWGLWIQFAMFIPMLVCGWIAIRSEPLEDQLGLSVED